MKVISLLIIMGKTLNEHNMIKLYSAITAEISVLNEAGDRSTTQEPHHILGSTATLICYTPTATGPLSYLWSSTSNDFFAYNSTSMFNKKRLLSSADAGIHTCTVTDAYGNSGQANMEMKFDGTLHFYNHYSYTLYSLYIWCCHPFHH